MQARQAATGVSAPVAWTPLPPGYGEHPAWSCLRRVEHGNPVARRGPNLGGGGPVVRPVDVRGGHRMAQEANAGGRKALGNGSCVVSPSLRGGAGR